MTHSVLGIGTHMPVDLTLPNHHSTTDAGDQALATTNLNVRVPSNGYPENGLPGEGLPDPIAEAFRRMPSVGEQAFGFVLLRELGQGTFGRVFLAAQSELAGRKVVLKLSADLTGESRALAQLQHTNIVPVYSVHRENQLQAVCMPYFGSMTLARLIRHYRDTNSLPTSGLEFVRSFRTLSLSQENAPRLEPEAAPQSAKTEQLLSILASGSYTRAVAWLVARLADGLAHAHERGMIHRDIKPANILLTDDGQPMLLDFGLAEDLSRRATVGLGTIGGTLAYMAPEQLNEIRTKQAEAGPASDLFSLGVVFYELLTGRFPYEEMTAPDRMIQERLTSTPPRIRSFNPEVTPGLESIAQLCLAPRPEDRYPSAAALRDDLDRFLSDLPLRTAPETSWSERAQKWSRRHPRLASYTTFFMLVIAITVIACFALLEKRSRLHQLEAEQTFRQFVAESKAAQLTLYARPDDETALAKGEEQGRAAVAHYGVQDKNWTANSLYAALTPRQQLELRHELAETYLLLARAAWFRATRRAVPDHTGIEEALQLNQTAENLIPDDPPRLIYIQRRTMFTALGRMTEAAEAVKILSQSPPRSARDFYFEAAEESAAGRPKVAAGWYRRAQEADPKAFWPYYGEGTCHVVLSEWVEARGCFTAALALDADSPDARANRALANLRLGDAAAAEIDATHALTLQPDRTDTLLVRAEARTVLKNYQGALADAELAMTKGATSAALTMRAHIRKQSGQAEPAGPPTTAAEWIHHGLNTLSKDPAGALKAFEQAIQLEPNSVTGYLCRAHVLGETHREAECAATLTKVLELDPKHIPARSARGVMYARLERDAEAIADARATLDLSFTPIIVYQVAGIFARVSARQPEYAEEALHLLKIALRGGAGLDLLGNDPELDSIRKRPEFLKLVEEARKARPLPSPK